MLNFLFFVAIVGAVIYVLVNYILQKQKKMALENLYQEYARVFERFKALPRDVKDYVTDIHKRLVFTLQEIERKYQTYKNDPDIMLYVKEKKITAKELERQIAEHKRKWDIYDKFLNDVGTVKLNLENLKKDILKRVEDITITFGNEEVEPKEKETQIREESENVIRDIDSVYRVYESMQSQNYSTFDVRKLSDSEVLLDQVLTEGEQFYDLLKAYNKEIVISLIGLSRHSTYYLKLKELLEGYKSGKNKMANLGEVPVSYQTYYKLEEGSKYRQDVFVSSKRVGQEMTASYFVKNGNHESYFEDKLTYDEMLDLLVIANRQPSDEEMDENKLAYNFNLQELDVEVARKEKNELLIKYKKNSNVLKRVPLRN